MKMFIVLLFISLVVVGGKAEYSPEEKAKHREMEVMCQKESHLTDDDIARAMKRDYADNIDKLKIQSFCMYKKFNFMNDAGELLADNIKTHMYEHDENGRADKIMANCIVQKDAPLETAWALTTCLIPLYDL